MTHKEALERCKAEVSRRGFRVSDGSWSEEGQAYAFSMEHCGPATYGHSQCAIQAVDRGHGWVFLCDNRPINL